MEVPFGARLTVSVTVLAPPNSVGVSVSGGADGSVIYYGLQAERLKEAAGGLPAVGPLVRSRQKR